ncbi:MAG: hypothetical protein HPY59_13460 [Anaerolineae bacterium]|nr:hypothetical protein [Anaerolineae bacterium]
MKFIRSILWLCVAWLLAACSAVSSQEVETSLPPTGPPVETITSTVIWFPATDTPRPVVTPTLLPTRDLRPGVGEQIFSDLFTPDSEWQLARDAAGSVAYGNHELTLAIRQPKAALFSLNRQLFLSDFYLEVTANPSLCRGEDVYGLLLRAAAPTDAYRFLVSCNGQLRLERIKNSKVVILQDWTPSGQVPPGSPAILRIGVWALRNELRFFVNDFYQFSASDPIWRNGGLGFYARSAGANALTVNFTNLAIYTLNPEEVPPTETPTATPPPTATVTRIAPRPTYLNP